MATTETPRIQPNNWADEIDALNRESLDRYFRTTARGRGRKANSGEGMTRERAADAAKEQGEALVSAAPGS